MGETYLEHVRNIDHHLGPFAFRSDRISRFTDGTDAFRLLEDMWNESDGRSRLAGRTPLMLERDRILYSDELRRQADKNHLLFFRNQRVSRDYTTHTLRVVQVARSICGRLSLNADLAEAIALGCKVGAVPFLHVAKTAVDAWARGKLNALDTSQQPREASRSNIDHHQGVLLDIAGDGRTLTPPSWLQHIQSETVRMDIARYMPWAAGNADEPTYSSGQQSYWLLSTNPFLLSPKSRYIRQTMYGIWRHSLSVGTDVSTFHHEIRLLGADSTTTLSLNDGDLTHETVVVRYADDVTWVIENLSEANRAAALYGQRDAVFSELALYLVSQEMPDPLARALQPVADTGRLYTYFIDDLVRTSTARMEQAPSTHLSETEPLIALSPNGGRMLRLMKSFLDSRVFIDDRIRLRNRTLAVISETILDLLFESHAEALVEMIRLRSKLEGWTDESQRFAEALADNAVHRIQACVDTLALMSDREVYDFIGLEGI